MVGIFSKIVIQVKSKQNNYCWLFKDIGALSEENFDAVDWINKTLKKTDDQQNKEVHFKCNHHIPRYLTGPNPLF